MEKLAPESPMPAFWARPSDGDVVIGIGKWEKEARAGNIAAATAAGQETRNEPMPLIQRFRPERRVDAAIAGGSLISRLIAGNIVVAGLLIVLGWLALQSSHRAYAGKARDATESLTASLRQSIAADIRRVDMAMITVRSSLARNAVDPAGAQALLDEQLALLASADSLRVTDADGIVRLGRGVNAGAAVDLSDRDFFRRARAAGADELIVSEPIEARISKKWVIALARRVFKPDGSFGGVVYANVSADAFARKFEEVDVGRSGAITLRSSARQLIARRSPGASGPPAYGNTTVSKEFSAALAANPKAGFFISKTALDGIERMSAFRMIDDYPLIVLVGLSTSDYFAPWRQLAWQVAALLGLAISTLAAVSVFVARSYARERQSAHDLALEGLRSRALLRSASDGVQILDRQGLVHEASESMASLLGRRREDLLGHHVSEWDLQMAAPPAGDWLKGLQVGEHRRFETNYRRQDGATVAVEVFAVVVQIGDDEWVHCSVRDITERNRLLEELTLARDAGEALSRELAAMLEHSQIAVLRVKGAHAVWTNPAAERIFGYTRSEFIGMSSARFYADPQVRERTGQAARAAIAAGQPFRTQLAMHRKDGSEVWIDMSIASLSGTGDEVIILLADISELRQAEGLRIEATRLEAQNAVLLETARQKDLFLANMSHELRTPLNAVIGFSELMRHRGGALEPAKVLHYTTQILASGKALLEVIDRMLDTALLDARKIEFHPEAVDVQAALEDVREMLATRCEARNVSIGPPQVDAAVREVYLDSLRLRQVMLNLIGNAVKFSHPGGLVRVRVIPALPGHFCLEVQDDGIGIADADLDALFVPFTQLSSGHTKTHGGTGLGLTLVRRLVEAQGGTISLTSTLGVGTIVRVTLPRSTMPSGTPLAASGAGVPQRVPPA